MRIYLKKKKNEGHTGVRRSKKKYKTRLFRVLTRLVTQIIDTHLTARSTSIGSRYSNVKLLSNVAVRVLRCHGIRGLGFELSFQHFMSVGNGGVNCIRFSEKSRYQIQWQISGGDSGGFNPPRTLSNPPPGWY